MDKLELAKYLLEEVGMPPKQQSSLCCLTLLAMAKLTPNTPCRKASNDWIRIQPRLSSSVKPNGSRGSSYPTPPSILLPYSEASQHLSARTRRSRIYFSSTICVMRLMLLLLWLMMSGTRSTTTIEVSRPNAFGSSMPILLIRAYKVINKFCWRLSELSG